MDREEEYEGNRLKLLLETYSLEEIIETYSDYEDWEILQILIRMGYLKIDFKTTQMELDFS